MDSQDKAWFNKVARSISTCNLSQERLGEGRYLENAGSKKGLLRAELEAVPRSHFLVVIGNCRLISDMVTCCEIKR